jgi:hypothetical protein
MFVADFDSQRDRDRVKAGSPWHVSHNAVIIEEFVDHMQPSELKFDKLQVWARVMNLPFNLRDDLWTKAIARRIDKNATSVHIDPVGGYLRARVTIDVNKPLRRGLLIDSAKRNRTDWYEIQYEQIPHFCFSCGRLGHADMVCPTPGSRDEEGNLPFGPELRADDKKKAASAENSLKEKVYSKNSGRDTSSSSTAADGGGEVTSPEKRKTLNKRKGGSQQIYRKVVPVLAITNGGGDAAASPVPFVPQQTEEVDDHLKAEEPPKKKPTPPNSESAGPVLQPCQSQ